MITNKQNFMDHVVFPLCSITVTLVLWFGLIPQEARTLFTGAILKVLWPY